MIKYNEEELKKIKQGFDEIIKQSYQKLSSKDIELIKKALDLATEAHKDQRRKSGEPYIYHPIAVAKIVATEIGLGTTSIAAALMHDVVEDTEYTIEYIERIFGKEIAVIIEGLTKISHMQGQNISLQAENFRKMLLTLSNDVRVVLIKLADRLHNMQTMDFMPPHKQQKIASETLYIYAPMAHRLGLYRIKTELEDLGIKYTESEDYFEIVRKLEETKEEQDKYINNFTSIIKKSLDSQNIDYSIKGRTKSIFSIRKKMKTQSVTFEEVYDRFAIRIIYKSNIEEERFTAWKVYSIVTDNFQPNPKRLRDWLSAPKSNGYEALHTTVMGPLGRWVEVQIRSERMDEIAEKGYAAHYLYKEGKTIKNKREENENKFDSWINKVRETLENPDSNAVDFVDNFKLDLLSKEIYTFTPNGDLKTLPKGATSLDFAFSIHSKVGEKCLGAKVNGKLVPLNYKLSSGDQIEIITSQNQKPKYDWLDFVITSKAKSRIKSALNDDKKEVSERGREILIRKFRHLKTSVDDQVIHQFADFCGLHTSQDLFYKIAIGAIDNTQIREFAAQHSSGIVGFLRKKIARRPKSTQIIQPKNNQPFDQIVFGADHEYLDYKLSPCCSPIPGDEIFGFVTIHEGIKVHKKDCPNSISLQANYAYRIMKAKWTSSNDEYFNVTLNIEGIDIPGITSKITRAISTNSNINLRNINLSSSAGLIKGKIMISLHNQTQLDTLIKDIKSINGVSNITRTL